MSLKGLAKNSDCKLNNNRGISLIETLVAVALTAVLGFAMMQILDIQNKTKITTETQLNILELTHDLRNILAKSDLCTYNFKDKSYQTSTPLNQLFRRKVDPLTGVPLSSGSGSNVSTSNLVSASTVSLVLNNPNADRYKVNDMLVGGLKIKAMTLTPNSTTGQAQLKITLEKTGDQVYGTNKTEIDLGLFVMQNPENPLVIKSCYLIGAEEIDKVEMCEAIGGVYDTTTNKCSMPLKISNQEVFCPNGSSYRLVKNGAEVSFECPTRCTPIRVFARRECGYVYGRGQGMGAINKCFYKYVCQEDPTVILRGPAWDGVQGPMRRDGDASNLRACRRRAQACPGE